jgi:uncharacterized protein
MEINGKTVVITGATGGIGKELAKVFAKEGAKLILIARTHEKLEWLLEELEGEGHIIFDTDFTQTDKIDELAGRIAETTEKIDILINAAGVGVYNNVEDVSRKEWEDSISINVTAPFYLTKALLPKLKNSEKSVVVNIGSGMGKIPTACRSVYCTTKFALRGMTMSLAEEFKATNVNFIHIALGSTLTDFGPMSLQEKEEENLKGKTYLTPGWVAKRFVEIVKLDKYEEEIELYPTVYKNRR